MKLKIHAKEFEKFAKNILYAVGVRKDLAINISEGIKQNSLRGIDSHGIRLLPHYIQGLVEGRLNKNPDYKFTKTSSSTGKLDGDHAPGYGAGARGMLCAIELANEAGIGAVTVFNSSHFGAAAYYAFMAAEKDMLGLSFTHATAHVLSFKGKRPFFGNNPICIAAPCHGEEPFCLDMATTVSTFNNIQHYKELGKKVPLGLGVDKNGEDTDDPAHIESLISIGGYKGFGLSMMVEILCSLLSGMPYGRDVSSMFGVPMDQKRYLGHFFMAIKIASFEDPNIFKKRLKEMMDSLRQEPSFDPELPVLVPGDPEKTSMNKRSQNGIPISRFTWKEYEKLSFRYDVPLPDLIA
jgi:ureidoglycolate dehydrogenase (NAD+)|tara:strand:- start:1919 stop:2971 length:1053 start_codon:yes stop_codon:yes gene_type:complete